MDLKSLIDRIDKLIKEGKPVSAQQALYGIRGRIPRESVAAIAGLSRRVFLPHIGIRLLNPILRPSGRSQGVPSEAEETEYASCLTRIGAADEALDILTSVDPKIHPEALMARTYALVTKWAYEETIPLLKQYLSLGPPQTYQRLIAEVNLASAYISERLHGEATPLLAKLHQELSRGEYGLLRNNVLQLSAMNAIFLGQWKEARLWLDEEARTSPLGSMENFFLRKWEALLELHRQGPTKQTLKQLAVLRSEAIEKGHWETSRDCDRYLCIVLRHEPLFHRLYFGTPHEGFRRWLVRGFPSRVEIPSQFEWRSSEDAGKPSWSLDLGSGTDSRGKRQVKSGELIHALMSVILSDFYAPPRLAGVHYRLYPGEFYNPVSSPSRVHQAMTRFRKWASANKIPLRIEEREGRYHLLSSEPVAIKVSRLPGQLGKQALASQLIRSRWPETFFSAVEAGKLLKTTNRSALRLLSEEIAAGKIEKVGQGPGTRYRFKKAA